MVYLRLQENNKLMLVSKTQIHSLYLWQEQLQVWVEVGAHLWDSCVTLSLVRG